MYLRVICNDNLKVDKVARSSSGGLCRFNRPSITSPMAWMGQQSGWSRKGNAQIEADKKQQKTANPDYDHGGNRTAGCQMHGITDIPLRELWVTTNCEGVDLRGRSAGGVRRRPGGSGKTTSTDGGQSRLALVA